MGKFLGMKLDSLLVLAVIIVGVVWLANYAGVFATTGGIGTTAGVGPVCEFDDLVTLSVVATNSILDVTNAETRMTAETISVYVSTDTTTAATNFMTVAGVANQSVTLPCHAQYKFALQNSALYYNMSYPVTGYLGAEHAAESTKMKLDLVGAFALTLDNSTTLGSASFTVAGGGGAMVLGNSVTSNGLVLHIRQTTAQGTAKAPIIIGFAYNSTAFAAARAIGWQSIACPSWAPAITMATTGATNPYRSCYVHNSDLKDITEITVPIQLQTGVVGPVIENVTMRIDDTGGAFKSGTLVTGFTNPDNGNDWGMTGATFIMHVE